MSATTHIKHTHSALLVVVVCVGGCNKEQTQAMPKSKNKGDGAGALHILTSLCKAVSSSKRASILVELRHRSMSRRRTMFFFLRFSSSFGLGNGKGVHVCMCVNGCFRFAHLSKEAVSPAFAFHQHITHHISHTHNTQHTTHNIIHTTKHTAAMSAGLGRWRAVGNTLDTRAHPRSSTAGTAESPPGKTRACTRSSPHPLQTRGRCRTRPCRPCCQRDGSPATGGSRSAACASAAQKCVRSCSAPFQPAQSSQSASWTLKTAPRKSPLPRA